MAASFQRLNICRTVCLIKCLSFSFSPFFPLSLCLHDCDLCPAISSPGISPRPPCLTPFLSFLTRLHRLISHFFWKGTLNLSEALKRTTVISFPAAACKAFLMVLTVLFVTRFFNTTYTFMWKQQPLAGKVTKYIYLSTVLIPQGTFNWLWKSLSLTLNDEWFCQV